MGGGPASAWPFPAVAFDSLALGRLWAILADLDNATLHFLKHKQHVGHVCFAARQPIADGQISGRRAIGQPRHGGVDSFVSLPLKFRSGADFAHVLAHVRTGPSLLVEITGTRSPTLPAPVSPHVDPRPRFSVERHCLPRNTTASCAAHADDKPSHVSIHHRCP